MKFGVSKQCITPLWPVKLSGYANPSRRNRMEGIHDDLFVRSILFDDGEKQIVFIVCDTTGVDTQYVNNLKKEIGDLYNLTPDCIVIQPTHSHSAPSLRKLPDENNKDILSPEDRYYLYVKERILISVSDCFKYRFEGTLEYSSGESYVSMNRRLKKGNEYIIGPNPGGLVDRNLAAIRIKDNQGLIKAILFNIALHGTVLKYINMLASGDAPGAACAELEKKYPGCTAVFIQGAEGDTNPAAKYSGVLQDKIAGFDDVYVCGKTLAVDVEGICKSMKEIAELNLKTALKSIKIPYDVRTAEFLRNRKGKTQFFTMYEEKVNKLIQILESGNFSKDFDFQVGYIELCPEIRIITLEGEVFSEIGLNIRKLFDNKGTIVAGLANGSKGYIPTEQAVNEGGYETEGYIMQQNPGPISGKAGEIIVDAVKKHISSNV